MNIQHKWFQDYEAREAFFHKHVSGLIPVSYRGPSFFWREFTGVTPAEVSRHVQRKTTCITAFPQDSLAFASPMQVLRAAAMGQNDALALERQAIELFRLKPLLNQALRTLSGGETVRLALAKAWLNAPTHNEIYVASPYNWLDKHNSGLTETVARAYLNRNKPVIFLALTGEDTDAEKGAADYKPMPASLPEAAFGITAKNLRLKLSQSLTLGTAPLWVNVNDFELKQASPCLVLGENGAGKSLFVKTLAKVNGYRGKLEINSGASLAPCRLLQQNTLSQSLLREKEQFAPVSFGPLLAEFSELKVILWNAMTECLKQPPHKNSILDLKLTLAAARLCQNPKLLILDEPEWGLSYAAVMAFVYSVCTVAHKRGIPVILVSHKNWWLNIARSRINIVKETSAANHKQRIAFGMHIESEAL